MDPSTGIGILAAVFAGAISFLSPCVLPLVPGYLAAVTGVSPAELDRASLRQVLLPSLIFVASFSAIFIVLGVTASGFRHPFNDSVNLLLRERAEALGGGPGFLDFGADLLQGDQIWILQHGAACLSGGPTFCWRRGGFFRFPSAGWG